MQKKFFLKIYTTLTTLQLNLQPTTYREVVFSFRPMTKDQGRTPYPQTMGPPAPPACLRGGARWVKTTVATTKPIEQNAGLF